MNLKLFEHNAYTKLTESYMLKYCHHKQRIGVVIYYCAHLLFSGNPCRPNPCSYNGKCVLNGYGGYKCKCVGGYAGSRCESKLYLPEIQNTLSNFKTETQVYEF